MTCALVEMRSWKSAPAAVVNITTRTSKRGISMRLWGRREQSKFVNSNN